MRKNEKPIKLKRKKSNRKPYGDRERIVRTHSERGDNVYLFPKVVGASGNQNKTIPKEDMFSPPRKIPKEEIKKLRNRRRNLRKRLA